MECPKECGNKIAPYPMGTLTLHHPLRLVGGAQSLTKHVSVNSPRSKRAGKPLEAFRGAKKRDLDHNIKTDEIPPHDGDPRRVSRARSWFTILRVNKVCLLRNMHGGSPVDPRQRPGIKL